MKKDIKNMIQLQVVQIVVDSHDIRSKTFYLGF